MIPSNPSDAFTSADGIMTSSHGASDADHAGSVAAHAGHPPRSAVRWAVAVAGVLCVGMAAVGVVVPGMPTTVFLIAACWCFARSCPWLEQKLIRNRFFAPFLQYLEPGAVMPMRARIITLLVLVACVGASCVLLVARERPLWVVGVVAMAGVVGAACVWRVARPK